jgi:hypothetical protein
MIRAGARTETAANALGYVLLVAAWFAAYALRPTVLGFYDDDWAVLLDPTQTTAPFSLARLAYHMELYANRPGSGLLTFLMSSLCGAAPLAWHIAISVLILGLALCLRAGLRAALQLLGFATQSAADVAVAAWLLFPWTLGMTAWPTVAVSFASVGGFALALRACCRGWRAGHAAWAATGLWFLASILTYESFYGQFLLLAAFAWLAAPRVAWRRAWPPLAACAVAQVGAIAWNRVVPHLTTFAPSKSPALDPWGTLSASLATLPHFVGQAAREFSPWLEGLLLLGATLWLAAQLLNRRVALQRVHAVRAVLILGVGLAGAGAALVLYALVGHRLAATGLSSRTTLTPSFWAAVALAVLWAALPRTPRVVPLGAHVYATAVLLLFGMAQNFRVLEWGTAWTRAQHVLAAAPLAQLRQAQPGAVVLYDGPYKYRGIRVFGATWNLNHAMAYTYPELRGLHFCEARADRLSTWDGRHFEQRLADPRAKLRRTVWNVCETPEVWLWDGATNALRPLTAPYTHPAPAAPREARSATPAEDNS